MDVDFSFGMENLIIAENDQQLTEEVSDAITTISVATRSLRNRSISESSLLHRTRNRKIDKPKKIVKQPQSEREVINFYKNCNKKFKDVKPSLLETIFEDDEEDEVTVAAESPTTKFGRKTKRVIAVCNGLDITKALKEKRKGLIKKHLGIRKRPKKIALARFMELFKDKTAEIPKE